MHDVFRQKLTPEEVANEKHIRDHALLSPRVLNPRRCFQLRVDCIYLLDTLFFNQSFITFGQKNTSEIDRSRSLTEFWTILRYVCAELGESFPSQIEFHQNLILETYFCTIE